MVGCRIHNLLENIRSKAVCHLTPIKLILWGTYVASQSFVAFFDLCLLYYRLNGTDEDFVSGEFTTDSMVQDHHVYQELWTPITGVCAGKKRIYKTVKL